MPYRIVKRDSKYCLAKPDGSIVKGSCHDSREETSRMMRALYANEVTKMQDTLIYFGDAVKVLDDNGRVGGYLVRFSPDKRKDLAGEYFDEKSYLGPKDGDGAECIFDHGYPVPADKYYHDLPAEVKSTLQSFADRTFQPIKTTRDAIGIFAETVLNLEDEYEKFIHSRVKAGRVGWSSGAPGHRVVKNADGYISRWPIAEGSLTPCPCEPLNVAIPLKSLSSVKFVDWDDAGNKVAPKGKSLAAILSQRVADMSDDGDDAIIKRLARELLCEDSVIKSILDGKAYPTTAQLKGIARVLKVDYEQLKTIAARHQPKTMKGIFADAVREEMSEGLCSYELWSLYGGVISDIATIAEASAKTGTAFDRQAKVAEATGELSTYLQQTVNAQIDDWLSGDDEMESYDPEAFYLRSILRPESLPTVTVGLSIEDHSQLAVAALKGIAERFRKNHEARKRESAGNPLKAGRVLSEKNRQRLASLVAGIKQAVADCESLLDETQPMASDEEKRAALSEMLRTQYELEQLGV